MEVFFIFVLVVAVAALILQGRQASARINELVARLNRQEFELERLQRRGETSDAGSVPPAAPPPPILTPPLTPDPAPILNRVSAPPPSQAEALPPIVEPEPAESAPAAKIPEPPVSKPAVFNWESFVGIKLFAWIGGLILFLGVAFFIKYSFDNNLVSPAMRVTSGYLIGVGLVAGGLRLTRVRHAVTVQTLCATGIVILYANIFASHSYYKFLGATPAFGLMTAVTAVAFVLAARLNAQVVSLLGLLGGFLTPPLLATGVDNPLGLFGYLALLDIGLLAVALRQRWDYQILLAALATTLMQTGWVQKFFTPEKIHTAMSVFLGFSALFVAGFAIANRRKQVSHWVSAAAILPPFAALGFALFVFWHPYRSLANQPVLMFSHIFLADLGLLALAWLHDKLRPAHLAGGAAVFLLLTTWTVQYLSADHLNFALGAYLLFAVLHSIFPVVLQRRRPTAMSLGWIHLYAPLTLLLILAPLLKLDSLSFVFWPVILLIDLLAIGLAVITASLVSILVVVVLTTLATAVWIFKLPPLLSEVPGMLVVIGGFAVFFVAAGIFAARKVFTNFITPTEAGRAEAGVPLLTPSQFGQLAALAALLPFLLLTLMVLRLPLADPTPVFGLAALLAVLLLGVLRFVEVDLLAAVTLLAVLLVEHAWHTSRFSVDHTRLAVGWYLGFAGLFLGFPFLFARRLEKRVVPWVAAALALPLHFYLIHDAMVRCLPDFAAKGLIPAALAVPCLLGLAQIIRRFSTEHAIRNTLLALFGGASLFFITLIFPIQFERQWLTISWALEGTALLCLFRRVPHPGLRLTGVALLVVTFMRLALNPAVIEYHARTNLPFWNWYLYAYGLGALCLMVGARLLAPPRHQVGGLNLPPILYTLGVVLAFLLVNLEIADYFTTPGQNLVFHFSGNLAQDMTYSLAWGLFAFVLLSVGFKLRNAPTRYAGMGLLVVTIVKLFLHDLWQLGGLYRIGSLIGLAVLLIVISFIYQRFGSAPADKDNPPPST